MEVDTDKTKMLSAISHILHNIENKYVCTVGVV